MDRIDRFLLLNKKLTKAFLVGLALFVAQKIVFIIRFGNIETFKNHINDLPLMIFNGFRFDLQVLTYIFSLFLLLNIISLFINSEKGNHFINKISVQLIPVFLALALLIQIADQQFYSFFKLHFNTVAFDFLDEGPKLLLKSIWIEHPVIKIFIIIIITYFILRFLIRKIYRDNNLLMHKLHWSLKSLVLILFLGIYFIMMRGSLGTFPLQNEATTVSGNEFINACVPNPLFSLKEAFEEAKEEINIEKPEIIIKKFGYNDIKQAIADYYEIPLDSIKSSDINDLIFTKSQNDLAKKYNVVYFIMESMSNHFIDFHNAECNLLGSFEKHFNQDIVFRNFQSSGNGTIVSLENIILNAPFHSILETKYRFRSYDISIAKPFKDAGYTTSFITGIDLGWRHLDESLKIQYFDNAIGKIQILNEYSEAESNKTWGVFDHDVFDYIFKVLSEKPNPQFILNLSSTNHTPYELPGDYNPYPINPEIADSSIFSAPIERCLEVLKSFQYSNDALGRFMDKIKNSPLSENTIVIITGDHNIRSIINYNTENSQHLKYSVPLYIYLPQDLKKSLHIDTTRYGSHYDIIKYSPSLDNYFSKIS